MRFAKSSCASRRTSTMLEQRTVAVRGSVERSADSPNSLPGRSTVSGTMGDGRIGHGGLQLSQHLVDLEATVAFNRSDDFALCSREQSLPDRIVEQVQPDLSALGAVTGFESHFGEGHAVVADAEK